MFSPHKTCIEPDQEKEIYFAKDRFSKDSTAEFLVKICKSGPINISRSDETNPQKNVSHII